VQSVTEFLNAYAAYTLRIFTYPLHLGSRVYLLYLATSAIAAWFIYRAARRRGRGNDSFLRLLFPRHI